MENDKKRVPFLLWPFWFLWKLTLGILGFTGRILGLILGFTAVILGIVLSLTVIGAIFGVPLILFGVMLMIRCIF